jgi:hypothetical protein
VSFTIVTLFSCIIPLGPLILLITTSININLIFYADLYFFKKSPPEVSKSIGLWAGLIEFVIIIAIAFNSALLYFATKNMFNEYIGVIKNNNEPDYSEVSVGENNGALFIISIVEHFIIAFLYVVKFVIPSVPGWIIEETESMMKLIDDDIKYIIYHLGINKC